MLRKKKTYCRCCSGYTKKDRKKERRHRRTQEKRQWRKTLGL